MLAGFMGTGKTSAGKRIAERLHWSFVDTDEMIEKREGRSIAEIFERDGEPHFRALEREAVAAAAAKQDAVIALGGGAMVDDDNFDLLRRAGLLVCLHARPEVILARTSGAQRPLLLTEDREARVRQLLQERQSAYARAPHHIDTSDLTIDECAERVLALFGSATSCPEEAR